MCACVLSHVQLFMTPWTVAHQAPCPWDSPGKNPGVGCHASSSRSSWPWDWTHVSCVSCIGRWSLYHGCHLGNTHIPFILPPKSLYLKDLAWLMTVFSFRFQPKHNHPLTFQTILRDVAMYFHSIPCFHKTVFIISSYVINCLNYLPSN